MGLALALVHHLAIGNNLPFARIARTFAGICRFLAVEFVPKEDSPVQKMLRSRVDIFSGYDRPSFEKAFQEHFKVLLNVQLKESTRVLYLMEKK